MSLDQALPKLPRDEASAPSASSMTSQRRSSRLVRSNSLMVPSTPSSSATRTVSTVLTSMSGHSKASIGEDDIFGDDKSATSRATPSRKLSMSASFRMAPARSSSFVTAPDLSIDLAADVTESFHDNDETSWWDDEDPLAMESAKSKTAAARGSTLQQSPVTAAAAQQSNDSFIPETLLRAKGPPRRSNSSDVGGDATRPLKRKKKKMVRASELDSSVSGSSLDPCKVQEAVRRWRSEHGDETASGRIFVKRSNSLDHVDGDVAAALPALRAHFTRRASARSFASSTLGESFATLSTKQSGEGDSMSPAALRVSLSSRRSPSVSPDATFNESISTFQTATSRRTASTTASGRSRSLSRPRPGDDVKRRARSRSRGPRREDNVRELKAFGQLVERRHSKVQATSPISSPQSLSPRRSLSQPPRGRGSAPSTPPMPSPRSSSVEPSPSLETRLQEDVRRRLSGHHRSEKSVAEEDSRRGRSRSARRRPTTSSSRVEPGTSKSPRSSSRQASNRSSSRAPGSRSSSRTPKEASPRTSDRARSRSRRRPAPGQATSETPQSSRSPAQRSASRSRRSSSPSQSQRHRSKSRSSSRRSQSPVPAGVTATPGRGRRRSESPSSTRQPRSSSSERLRVNVSPRRQRPEAAVPKTSPNTPSSGSSSRQRLGDIVSSPFKAMKNVFAPTANKLPTHLPLSPKSVERPGVGSPVFQSKYACVAEQLLAPTLQETKTASDDEDEGTADDTAPTDRALGGTSHSVPAQRRRRSINTTASGIASYDDLVSRMEGAGITEEQFNLLKECGLLITEN